MQHIVVDIETNGTCVGIHNMVSIGAVHHQNPTNTFYAEMHPLNDNFQPKAYEVNGFTHDMVKSFDSPEKATTDFFRWVMDIKDRDERIMFVSDTTSFDFSFVNFYLWTFCGGNPFGHAPLSLTNLFKGLTGDFRSTIYHLRDTAHTHNALDDAKGNQEAFAKIEQMMRMRRVTTKKSYITT